MNQHLKLPFDAPGCFSNTEDTQQTPCRVCSVLTPSVPCLALGLTCFHEWSLCKLWWETHVCPALPELTREEIMSKPTHFYKKLWKCFSQAAQHIAHNFLIQLSKAWARNWHGICRYTVDQCPSTPAPNEGSKQTPRTFIICPNMNTILTMLFWRQGKQQNSNHMNI